MKYQPVTRITKLAPTLLAAACLAFIGGKAAAAEYDLNMAVIISPGDVYTAMTQSVPDRIKEATDGKVNVVLSDTLVPPSEMASAIREGRIDFSAPLHTYLAAEEPIMGIFNLPGLIQSVDDYQKVGEAFWFDDTEKLWHEKYNGKLLATGAWCEQGLFSKEPLRTVEDFAGKRLRVHNPQTAQLVEALGGKAVPLSVPEIYPALERGVIDGLFTSTCVGNALEYEQVAPHVQNWKIGPITGWAIIANEDMFAELPSDIQDQITESMAQLQEEGFKDYKKTMSDAREDLKKKGADVWTVSDDEYQRVMNEKYIKPAFDTWYKRADEVKLDGKAYLDKVRETLAN